MNENGRFIGKKIAVLGFGVEGISSARFLLKEGAKVTIHDKLAKSELDQVLVGEMEQKGVGFVTGKEYLAELSGYDLLIRSPGISPLTPALQTAREKGVQISSNTQLFLDLCPAPVIGVTGTKGKGTTSTLIAEMLRKDERKVCIGGNIGRPPLDFLDTLDIHSWVVLEMSSFQLIDLTKSPHIAVVLMITSEHLDYHRDTLEYIDAKRNILRFQERTDYAVINRDYPASLESDVETNGHVYLVTTEREADEGCFTRQGRVVLRRDGKEKDIIDIEEILLPGKHNLENVCAAVMAATLAGVGKDAMVEVLRTFKGLEHRLQLVGEVRGVKYYDDSFSTTPETAIAAIKAFKAPEILILGGSSKGSDFLELGRVIGEAENIKAVIGVGVEWPRIRSSVASRQSLVLIEGARDMGTIVKAASKIAEPGDVVLLSPACASFDMFRNYKERGERFAHEVSKLNNPINE